MLPHLEGGRFYGKILRKRAVGELLLADVRYPAKAHLPRHAHEHAYFCLIRQGTYTEAYGRRERLCQPMTLAYHPPGEPHTQTFSDCPVASFNVEIGTSWLDRMREVTGPLDQPSDFHDGRVAALGLRLFHEFEAGESALSIETLALEILAATCGTRGSFKGSRPRWLLTARDLLDTRFAESLTLRAVAREAGVHPVYFAAAFRQFESCSVGDYLRRRRIEFVRGKLADPDLSLADIALDAGFADQSHLTRTFKRFTGMTPGEYRTFLRFKTR